MPALLHRPVVLHVTECFEGGVGKAVRSYVDQTDEFEHRLLAVGAEMEEERSLTRFAQVTELRPGLLRRIEQVRAMVNDEQVELVHAHSSWAGVYARVSSLSSPVLYQPHGYAFEMASRLKGTVYRTAESLLGRRRIASTVALSPREASLAMKVGGRSPVTVIPNAPTIAHAPAAVDVTVATTAPVITMIGRVCAQKDPEYFIRLLAEVRRHVPDARGRWIGDGEAQLVEALRAVGAEVTGWLDSEQLAESLDDTSVYVHTAQYEGFPLSVLDAAARRVPIHARAIHAFDGSPVLQHSRLLDHAAAVVRTLTDPGHRASVTAAGEDLLALMNTALQKEKLAALYQKVIAG